MNEPEDQEILRKIRVKTPNRWNNKFDPIQYENPWNQLSGKKKFTPAFVDVY